MNSTIGLSRSYALHLRVRASQLKNATQQLLTPTRPIILTATTPDGESLQLRPPRLDDAPAWRDSRLASQHTIEPFWAASDTPWHDRHTDLAWAHECHHARRAAQHRTCLSFVIDCGGRFTGQLLLDNLDTFNRTAEIGIWTRHDAPPGTAHTAAVTLVTAAFTELDLERVTAPIHPDNHRAQRFAARVGLTYEGRMRNYFTTSTGRADHLLYAITRPQFTALPGCYDNDDNACAPLDSPPERRAS